MQDRYYRNSINLKIECTGIRQEKGKEGGYNTPLPLFL
jgi:hypothetical protein